MSHFVSGATAHPLIFRLPAASVKPTKNRKNSPVGWADSFTVCPRGTKPASSPMVGKQKDARPPYASHNKARRPKLSGLLFSHEPQVSFGLIQHGFS